MNSRSLTLLAGGFIAGFILKGFCDAVPRHSGPGQPRGIRPAGRHDMADPPRHWDIVDEQGDESFPASDPPGNY